MIKVSHQYLFSFLFFVGALFVFTPGEAQSIEHIKNPNSRQYWVAALIKIANPVLENLSEGKLRKNMPVESKSSDRKNVTHLEAFGRTLDGIAPWLELGPDATQEGKLRAKYIKITREALSVAVNPSSPDFLNFTSGGQPLVDAAFMAQGLLRGFNQLWVPLDMQTKANIINALKSSRSIKPGENNWLLFSAMIETFLMKAGSEWDPRPINYALNRFSEWYKGVGIYGDGKDFHWDYYNSFVIQPMLLDITSILHENRTDTIISYDKVLKRAQRYAVIQERLISPEGTYPAIGRSLAYRFGAFQLLGQVSLMRKLPESISPAQIRSALSEVIHRQMEAPDTFDKNGWLTIGFCGHQPDIGEAYISTGSLYLCTFGLLPLGLPANDPFWILPPTDWTSRKVWKGVNLSTDHAF
jgi:hypothetical protein